MVGNFKNRADVPSVEYPITRIARLVPTTCLPESPRPRMRVNITIAQPNRRKKNRLGLSAVARSAGGRDLMKVAHPPRRMGERFLTRPSRRDEMIVARQFIAGLAFSNASVPSGTIEFRCHPTKNGPRCSLSIVPNGKDHLFRHEPSTEVLGYFH
jgi:hypothetical protein